MRIFTWKRPESFEMAHKDKPRFRCQDTIYDFERSTFVEDKLLLALRKECVIVPYPCKGNTFSI